MAWKVSEVFIDIQGCSELFLEVLMSFERFWKFSEGSEAFCDIWSVLWGILMRSHGSETVLEVSDIMWRFWVLWGNLRYPSEFWAILKDSWTFIVAWSEAFLLVLKGSIRFWGIIWLSGVFCFVLKRSHGFWVVLKDSCTLWVILWSYGDIVKHSKGISWILSSSEMFLNVLIGSLIFRGALTWSEALLLVMCGFEMFQKVLRHSLPYMFSAVHEGFWWF